MSHALLDHQITVADVFLACGVVIGSISTAVIIYAIGYKLYLWGHNDAR